MPCLRRRRPPLASLLCCQLLLAGCEGPEPPDAPAPLPVAPVPTSTVAPVANSQAAPWWYEEGGELDTVLAMGAGVEHACALELGGEARCWGRDIEGSTRPPPGRFQQLSAGFGTSCGLRQDGSLACWGWGGDGLAEPPSGRFRQVEVGYRHACAIDEAGAARCWGWSADGQTTPQTGPFEALALGQTHSCGLLTSGGIRCWGADPMPTGRSATMGPDGRPTAPPSKDGWVGGMLTSPPGRYRQLGAGALNSCALHEAGGLVCWGHDAAFQSRPPQGTFEQLAVGFFHACGIRDTGEPICWGWRGRRRGLASASGSGPMREMPITCPWEGLGLLYLAQGRTEEARSTLETAVELVPHLEHDKYNGLARIHLDEGRFDAAREALERSVAITPDPRNDAWKMLGELETGAPQTEPGPEEGSSTPGPS